MYFLLETMLVISTEINKYSLESYQRSRIFGIQKVGLANFFWRNEIMECFIITEGAF